MVNSPGRTSENGSLGGAHEKSEQGFGNMGENGQEMEVDEAVDSDEATRQDPNASRDSLEPEHKRLILPSSPDAGPSTPLLVDSGRDSPRPGPSRVSFAPDADKPGFVLNADSDGEDGAARPVQNDGKWFSGGTNKLKLSVGADDDEDDEEEDFDALKQDRLRRMYAPRQDDFVIDEAALAPDRIRQIIGGEHAFGTLDNRLDFDGKNFQLVDERYVEKKLKIVQDFLIGDEIGNGSYGKVKECIDQLSLTRRAVKIMKMKTLSRIPNGFENVQHEIEITRALDHDNCIRLYHLHTDREKGKIYMFMDFCMGSLQQQMDNEPTKCFGLGESHRFFLHLMRGIEYLHSLRIIHKDIKPPNLLISVNLVLKICDFGVAERLDTFQADGYTTKVRGTVKFQAPELVSGTHKQYDGYQADVWSCGVTLYNMVSGQYPFEVDPIDTENQNHHFLTVKQCDAIVHKPLEMPTNVELGEELVELLELMLIKEEIIRIRVPEIIRHKWFIRYYPEDVGLGKMLERVKTGSREMSTNQLIFDFFASCEEPQEMPHAVVEPAPASILPVTPQPEQTPSRRRRFFGIPCCMRPNNSPPLLD